jgi:hypothetical protein
MRGRAISPYRSLLWGIIFTRAKPWLPVTLNNLSCVFPQNALSARIYAHTMPCLVIREPFKNGILFFIQTGDIAPWDLKDDNDTTFLNESTKLTDRNARSEQSLGFN